MIVFIFCLLLLVVVVSGGLLHAYGQVPRVETRRRAARRDPTAVALHMVTAYGKVGQAPLWMLYIGSLSGLIYLSVRHFDNYIGLVLTILLMAAGLKVRFLRKRLPGAIWLAVLLSRPYAAILGLLSPVLKPFHRLWSKAYQHTGLYEVDDLLELFDRQAQQPDSRLSDSEIELAVAALSFPTRLVRDHVQTLARLKTVPAHEVLGPLVLDELHSSGQKLFPVMEKKAVVGVVSLDQARNSLGRRVADCMTISVETVSADDTLSRALTLCLETASQLLVAVDHKQRTLGVISLETILRQLLPSTHELS